MQYQQQIESWFAGKEALLLEGVSRLVSIRSVKGESAPGAPFGPGPAAALAEALKLAGEWGLLNPVSHEGYVGTADLNGEETALHILGHLDVVNEGEGWTVTEPYSPKVADGCIYGRGTDDDKGPVVVSMLAMKCVKDLAIPLKKNVRLIMGTDEESGSADIAYYFSKNPPRLYQVLAQVRGSAPAGLVPRGHPHQHSPRRRLLRRGGADRGADPARGGGRHRSDEGELLPQHRKRPDCHRRQGHRLPRRLPPGGQQRHHRAADPAGPPAPGPRRGKGRRCRPERAVPSRGQRRQGPGHRPGG